MLLVGPGGQNLIVMSDVANAGGFGANNANITFDDSAASGVPASGVITGTVTYKPTNASVGTPDSFPAPAPAPSVNTTLAAAFTGSAPNGTWSLYTVDDTTGDVGSISGGWSLTITTEEVAVATTTTLGAAQPLAHRQQRHVHRHRARRRHAGHDRHRLVHRGHDHARRRRRL